MSFEAYLGKKFLSTLPHEAEFSGLVILGTYFFRSDGGLQPFKSALENDPLETLKQVSHYLDGAFTLLYADPEENTLWVVTDPYCLNKIYYLKNQNQMVISNDIEDFSVDKSLSFDHEGLHEYLRFLDISAPKTCFKDVHILDGGQILKVLTVTEGFEIYHTPLCEAHVSEVSFDEAVEQTRIFLKDALDRRLGVVDKVGLFLSGGVDSSLLAGLYAELAHSYGDAEKLKAYTVGFEDEQLDESSIAESVAAHLGISHEVLKFDIEQEYQAFFEISGLLDVPFADPAVIPTFLTMQKMRADGMSGVMEGTGADGLIGASLPAFYHRVLKIDQFIPRTVRQFIAGILDKAGDPFGHRPYFDFESAEEKFIRWKGWKRAEIEKLCEQPCDFTHSAFYKAFQEFRNEDTYDLYRKLLVNMPDYRITDSCRLLGFQPVFPFFDQQLRDFVEGLPRNYKSNAGENKVLFKALLAQLVPRDIWDVPKHGFDYPFEKLLLYKDADLVERYLNEESLQRHNLFKFEVIMDYKGRFLQGDMDLKFKVWALVIFQCCYEQYYRRFLVKDS